MAKKKSGKIIGALCLGIVAISGTLCLGKNQAEVLDQPVVTNVPKQNMVAEKTSSKKDSGEEITIHYRWSGEQPHLYYSADGADTTFPGVPMKEEGNGWYTYTVSGVEEASFVLSVPSKNYETTEFTRTKGEYWYDESFGWSYEQPHEYAEPKMEAKEPELVELVEEATLMSEQSITVHYPSDWDKANIYYWNALPVDLEVEWPGEALEKDADGYYSYTFKGASKVNFLFSNELAQTQDYSIKNAGEYWFVNGEWKDKPAPTLKPGETVKPTETLKPEETKKPYNGTATEATFAETRTDFRDESIYFLMTTRFYDGDSGNNSRTSHDDEIGNPANDPSWRGDFKGLAQKLDYIKSLGFTAVWITPVVKNWSQYDYHGYHAYNFKQVDSRYCSSDFGYQDLIDAAHAKGIKVIQDIVLNHVGGHGEENLQTLSNNSAETINGCDGGNVYHHEGYIRSWESYQCQTTHIDGNCIDLNTENPSIIKYLVDAYNQYINMGVDGFRIDTVKHISRLGFNNEFIPAFQKAAKDSGNDDFYMFGEVCTRDENHVYFSHYACISTFFYTWKESKDYAWGDMGTNMNSVAAHWKEYEDYGEDKARAEWNSNNALLDGNEYHEVDYSMRSGLDVIDFPMHWAFRDAQNAFNNGKRGDTLYNDSTWNVVYVDSHDYAPNTMEKMRYASGTEAWAENMCLMFTFRGIPCIYYGSEVEFQAGKPIDKYDAPLANSGRAYFGEHIEGSVEVTDFATYSGATGTMAESLNYPLSKHVQRLNKIRQSVPALRKGQYSTENVDGSMAYKRRYTDESVDSFVCVTVTDGATFRQIPGGTYTDVVTGDVKEVEEGGTLTIDAPGKGNMRAYVLTTGKTLAPGKVGEDGTYLK